MIGLISVSLIYPMIIPPVKTELVMLGTGTPRPDPQRSGPAAAVVVNGEAYLVDCGPGVVRRAAAAKLKGINALTVTNIKTVFITHLHSDHTLGYPDLILSPWVVGRMVPLSAYGPRGLASMTHHILEAYKEDIDVRIHGLERGNRTGNAVQAHEIKPGVIYRDANVTVTAFLVKHGSWKEAFGYKFVTADRTIVFSGDTAPCDAVESAAKDADILVHEVYEASEAEPENRPGGKEWPMYMRAYHTSAAELGGIALRCKPKLLVLDHVLMRHGSDEKLIEEIRSGGFDGEVRVGNDLEVY